MPGNDKVESNSMKDGGAKPTTPRQPPKIPLLGISKINRGRDDSNKSSPDSECSDSGSGSSSSDRSSDIKRCNDSEDRSQLSHDVPFNEGTFQSITPRTLSLLTPRSAAAYNAAAFASFKGGSSSSFSPFCGTAAMQHSFKSYGKLMHYAAKAQDVDDLIKRTEKSVDRLRFSSVSFSNAWKLGKMASAVSFSAPDAKELELLAKEATFRDTVLAWKFFGAEEHPESVTCKPMDMHQCAEESFCAECTYLFAVFVATFYTPKFVGAKPVRQQRSTSADGVVVLQPVVTKAESEGEEEKEFIPERPRGVASTPGRKCPTARYYHHSFPTTSDTDEEDSKARERSASPPKQSATAHSSSSSVAFSEPTIIRTDFEDEDQDDADADREIADTLSSPPLQHPSHRLQEVRPVVPPPDDHYGSCASGNEEANLCAQRLFDTTMTPRGISSAFATLPRVKDDDVMHVNSAMLHHLGGSSSSLLGDHKEIGIGQVCINLHIWNGDKSSSFTRAAAFSKAIRLDRAWALPSAARAASLLVFSNASVDSGAVTTPRGEHVVTSPIRDAASKESVPIEYSMSALIRSKLLRTYRTLAASFSPGFLQMLSGGSRKAHPMQDGHSRGSESARKVLRVRLDPGALSPNARADKRSPHSEDEQSHVPRHRHHHRRHREVGDQYRNEIHLGGCGESDSSDNDDFSRPSVFKVPYNVVRIPSGGRERNGGSSVQPYDPHADTFYHLDQDEECNDGSCFRRVKSASPTHPLPSPPDGFKLPSPTQPSSEGPHSLPHSPGSSGGSSFRPAGGRKHLVVTVDVSRSDKPHSPGSKSSSSSSPSPSGSGDEKQKTGVSLKRSGKSVSTTALTPKKPAIPMLALGAVSDARRCNSQAHLRGTKKSEQASPTKSGMNYSVPKLPLSCFPISHQSEIVHPRSHSGDPSQEVRGRTDSEACVCACSYLDDIDIDDTAGSEHDRNGGEVTGGMRMYRGVLSKIDDQLYLTGEGGAQDLAALQELHVAQILNVADAVCHEYHPGQFKYLSIDLQDNGAKEDLRPLFLPTIDFIEKGRTVLHCQQGVSRSATFVIAYVMWKNHLTFRQALDYVMKRRPVISPNGGFMGQLLLWEVVLQNSRDALKSSPPRLLRMMAHLGSRHEVLMVAKDVANVSRACLDSRTCFLLHNPAARTVYMWIGNKCGPPLLAGAANVCEMMKKYLWVENVVEERQDFESDGFWRTLRDNRGSVGIVDEFNRDYAPRPPGFIYRYSAFDPVEIRSPNLNILREQTKRQAWVYYSDQENPLIVSVPPGFIMRLNGREITDGNEIATIIARLFCSAANIPETTPFTFIEDGTVILDTWLGTNPSESSTFKLIPAPRKDV